MLNEAVSNQVEVNPFYRSVGESEAAQWVLDNRNRVQARISKELRERGFGIKDVEECFLFCLNMFVENPHYVFDSEHYESSEYTIDRYVMSRVKYDTWTFIKDLERRRGEMNLHDVDEEDKQPFKTVSFDKASYNSQEDSSLDSIEKLIEHNELQTILEMELHIYNEQLKEYGFKDFCLRKYVQSMFLKEFSTDNKTVAKDLGVTPNRVKTWNDRFKAITKSNNEEFKDIPAIILKLIKGKQGGWNPTFI